MHLSEKKHKGLYPNYFEVRFLVCERKKNPQYYLFVQQEMPLHFFYMI